MTADIEPGWIADEVAEEFPRLRLHSVAVPGPVRKSPGSVRDRLLDFSDRVSAPSAVAMRQGEVAQAYRVFARQVGLDPDGEPGPLEAALIERMHRGEFRSAGIPADACMLAALETGVPVWAVDGDELVGSLGICAVNPAELIGRGKRATPVTAGRLAVADLRGPLAIVYDEPHDSVTPGDRSQEIHLYALGVPGVPDVVVHEALWIAGDLATSPI